MRHPRISWITACLTLASAPGATNPYAVPNVLKKTGQVHAETIAIPRLKAASTYSILFAVHSPGAFGADSQLAVDLSQGPAHLLHKTLHLGDPDLYAMFHVPKNGDAELKITILAKLASAGHYLLEVNRWPDSDRLNREPNHEWQAAGKIALGETVFASEDETPYIPAGPEKFPAGSPHWYRLDFDGAHPKLVFFQVELMERDNIPVDVAVYRVKNGKAEP